MDDRVEELVESTTNRMMAYWIGVVENDERDKLYADLRVIAKQILSHPDLAYRHTDENGDIWITPLAEALKE